LIKRPPGEDKRYNILCGSPRSGQNWTMMAKLLLLAHYDVSGRLLNERIVADSLPATRLVRSFLFCSVQSICKCVVQRFPPFSKVSTRNVLALASNTRYSGFLHGFSARRIKRESGANPELPRSGKQVRKPKMTLVPQGTGKSGE
jgi:hypothetical protein